MLLLSCCHCRVFHDTVLGYWEFIEPFTILRLLVPYAPCAVNETFPLFRLYNDVTLRFPNFKYFLSGPVITTTLTAQHKYPRYLWSPVKAGLWYKSLSQCRLNCQSFTLLFPSPASSGLLLFHEVVVAELICWRVECVWYMRNLCGSDVVLSSFWHLHL